MSILRNPRVVTGVSLVLALGMLAAGVAKLVRAGFEIEAFHDFELPTWLMIQVGVAEVIAALLLALPRTATLGAIIGAAIMTVAVPAHAVAGEYLQTAIPLVVLAGFVFVGWSRRVHLITLLRR